MSTFQMTALIKVTFQGADASGGSVNISVPGLKAGDVVLSIHNPSNPNTGERGPSISASDFGLQSIAVDDQITQQTGDRSAVTYTAVLLRFA